jgi:hypothetical protein
MDNQELWTGTIVGKTDDGQFVYFAGLTDTQIWWEIDAFYSAVYLSNDFYTFLGKILGKRQNLLYDKTTEKYIAPTNIVELEYIA